MLKPEGINEERKRIGVFISDARSKVEDAIDSELWSYIMESQLGKLEVAKKILEEVGRDIADTTNPAELRIAPVKPSQIIEVVADFYHFTTPTLTGRGQKKRIVLARQIAIYLIRQETNCTLAQIGKELGGRSATTVSTAYTRMANHLFDDGFLRVEIRRIQKKILEKVSEDV